MPTLPNEGLKTIADLKNYTEKCCGYATPIVMGGFYYLLGFFDISIMHRQYATVEFRRVIGGEKNMHSVLQNLGLLDYLLSQDKAKAEKSLHVYWGGDELAPVRDMIRRALRQAVIKASTEKVRASKQGEPIAA